LEVRGAQILRDDFRSRREGRFHPRLRRQALGSRFPGEQAGADHDAGIRRVRAGRDGRDHDRTMAELEGLAAVLAVEALVDVDGIALGLEHHYRRRFLSSCRGGRFAGFTCASERAHFL